MESPFKLINEDKYHILTGPSVYDDEIVFFKFLPINNDSSIIDRFVYIFNLSKMEYIITYPADKNSIWNDDDNDGYIDIIEIEERTIIWNASSKPIGFDNDLIPDSTDPDDDNDGYPHYEDLYPKDSIKWKNEENDSGDDNFIRIIFLGIVITISAILIIILKRSKQ